MPALTARAIACFFYVLVFGSLMGFVAFNWLLGHVSTAKVGTYAYVNPIVAVLLGYFLGGEPLGARTILGTLFVLVSVVLIAKTKVKKAIVQMETQEAVAQYQ